MRGRQIQPDTRGDGVGRRVYQVRSNVSNVSPRPDKLVIAQSVVEKISELTSGIFLVDGLLDMTELELVALITFDSETLMQMYGLLDTHPTTLRMAYVAQGKIDQVRLNLIQDEMPIWLTLLNTRAIAMLKGLNLDDSGYVRCIESHSSGRSISGTELLRNLRGRKCECTFPTRLVQGELYCGHGVAHFREGEVYIGKPLLPFLLSPKRVLDGELMSVVGEVREGLRIQLRKVYGKGSARISLVNAFPKMMQIKLAAYTKKDLNEFF